MKTKSIINLLINWIFGILFIIIGIGLAFMDFKFFAGLTMFVVAVVLLPPTAKLIETKLKLKISFSIKIIVGIIGFIIFIVLINTNSNSIDNKLIPHKQAVEISETKENINANLEKTKEVIAGENNQDNKTETESDMQQKLPKLSNEQSLRIALNKYYQPEKKEYNEILDIEIAEIVLNDNKAWVIYHSNIKRGDSSNSKWYYYLEDSWINEEGVWNITEVEEEYHGSKPLDKELELYHRMENLANEYAKVSDDLTDAYNKAVNDMAIEYNISTEEVWKWFAHSENWQYFNNEGKQWLTTVGSQYSDLESSIKDMTTSNITIKNEYGIISVLGEIKNNTEKTAKIIYITVTFYDKNGRIVDTAVDTQGNLSHGQTKTFNARGIYSSNFSKYKIDIDALY